MANKFEIGTIIHHKKYHYRGVIVSFTLSFKGEESWYQNNRSQPAKNQSWYHVLVDERSAATYVAEENLELDTTKKPVKHSLLKQYPFSFQDGKYHDNSNN